MSTEANSEIMIQVAPAGARSACVSLLADQPQAGRMQRIDAALQGPGDDGRLWDTLLAAFRGEAFVGSTWGQLLPGNTALVWPPHTVAGEPGRTSEILLQELDGRLAAQGVCVKQAVLMPGGGPDAEVLSRGGYVHAADLLYLYSDCRLFPRHAPAGTVNFERYERSQRDRMGRLIEATYEQTQDIPQLNGVREMEDVLTGYEQTGVFDPSRWFFVRRQGRDAGCLLLVDRPQEDHWELVYMGMVPEHRGVGAGGAVVRFAQWLAGKAGRKRVVLAVDAANEPAIAVYARAGFLQYDRREIFLKWA